MNIGLITILLLLILAFLGIPIYVALGIGTLVAFPPPISICWCCLRNCFTE